MMKSASIHLERMSGKLRNSSLWTDYTIRVYITDKVEDESTLAEIRVEQKSKNYKKKHKRWREHRCWNLYRNVVVMVYHPTIQN